MLNLLRSTSLPHGTLRQGTGAGPHQGEPLHKLHNVQTMQPSFVNDIYDGAVVGVDGNSWTIRVPTAVSLMNGCYDDWVHFANGGGRSERCEFGQMP